MRHRLRKKDRIVQAGKGNNKAQYLTGAPKRRGKIFRSSGETPEGRRAATERWAAQHSTMGKE